MRMNFVDVIAYLLLILGGIAWALTGLFDWNIFHHVFGGTHSGLSKLLYTLIGLSGLWALFSFLRMGSREESADRAEQVERSSGHEMDRDDRTHPAERVDRPSYGTSGHREDRRTSNYRNRRR